MTNGGGGCAGREPNFVGRIVCRSNPFTYKRMRFLVARRAFVGMTSRGGGLQKTCRDWRELLPSFSKGEVADDNRARSGGSRNGFFVFGDHLNNQKLRAHRPSPLSQGDKNCHNHTISGNLNPFDQGWAVKTLAGFCDISHKTTCHDRGDERAGLVQHCVSNCDICD